MREQIEALIKATERWRIGHRMAGRGIEAAACAIRLQALRECLEIVGPSGPEPAHAVATAATATAVLGGAFALDHRLGEGEGDGVPEIG